MDGKPDQRISRRSFVKRAGAGAAALGCAPMIYLPQGDDLREGGFKYHPHLDPLRVAGTHDTEMTSEIKPQSPWRVQDRLVQGDRVDRNLDLLACALTGEKEPGPAWKALFLKPAGKAWNEVTVAIKTNNLGRQHTKSAILVKLCAVLTGIIGVKASRIFIYDASHGQDMLRKSPFAGLQEDVQVVEKWGGFTREVTLPPPWEEVKGKAKCLGHLADGTVDILVNISQCKGHEAEYGGFTMTMKNHLGTFEPTWAHAKGRTEYIISVNKSPFILGPMDWKKKQVLFPRQQLCIVDALWASREGPVCPSSAQPNRLYMGVFPPAVDYLVAHRFRKELSFWPIDEAVTDRFLREFGYRPEDFPEGGKILDALKAS